MNEPSANPFFIVLLFILRCLVPLAVLFGISYLLRRMGLVAIESPEPSEEPAEKSPNDKAASSSNLTKAAQSEKNKKRKTSPPPGKKPAGKKPVGKEPASKTKKAGTLRSRSK